MRTITDDDAKAIARAILDEQASRPARVLHSYYGECTSGSFIYFIQCNATGPIKIGKTKDITRRLSNLQMGCPYPLVVVGFYWTADGDAEEERLHERFQSYALRGEWHRASPELLDFIAGCNSDLSGAMDRT